ncbi:MAG TPA: hypothetical protein PK243_11140 [Flexilinea sp.]|nr:hypothetical protein [Flexilinea sp.]
MGKTEFETVGYSIDYAVDGKYIGSVRIDEPDRENFGYHGRKTETLTEEVEKIKEFTTIIYY